MHRARHSSAPSPQSSCAPEPSALSPQSSYVARTVCNFCHVRCPALAEVQDGRVINIGPDPDHPYGGLLCVKGKAAAELVEAPDRLLYPLKRASPKTAPPEWVPVSWDQALDDIARRLLDIRARYGAETIVFSKGTRSGTGLVDAERWLRRLSNALGTPNTVSTTHLCQWPRDEGTRYTYGVRLPTPDLERSGCFLLWGCNPSTTNIRMAHDIQVARARGMKLVTIDPRRVGLATQSDLHLPVVPGTDGALALSIASVLVERGWFDAEFVRRWTNAPLLVRRDTGRLLEWRDVAIDRTQDSGLRTESARAPQSSALSPQSSYVAWDGRPVRYDPESGKYPAPVELLDTDATPAVTLTGGESVPTATVWRLLREVLAEYPPERAEAITGVPAGDIRAAAELLARNRPVAHYFWNGITQHTNAAQNGRAISTVYALLGDFDAPGGNVITPRPRIRDVELNSLLSHAQVERRLGWEERPLGAPRNGGNSAAYDLYRAVLEGEPYRARALLAFGNNMVMTNAGTQEGREALEQLDFMVCVDYFMTPTAQLADYVLPAATFLESAALVTGWELPIAAQTHLQYRAPAVAPRGEARSDTQIVFDLAVRLGLGDQFWNGDVEAAFRYELEPSGVSLEQLRGQPVGIQTGPAPTPTLQQAQGGALGAGYGERAPASPGARAYARETARGPAGFQTPTRKIELYASRFADEGQDPLPRYVPPHWSADRDPGLAAAYPFVLTNAKVTQFVHGQHRALPSLRRARPHPEVEMHPDTAARAGVVQGAWVAVETPEGAMRARVRLNPAIVPDVVFAQHGWWQACPELGLPGYSPYSEEGANVNLLVSNRHRDPISGGTPHRSARCRLRPLELDGGGARPG